MRKSIHSEKGQMSLVIAMMTSTFLFLTAFALGVGMLVHAKINLQNAADLAAYSGAAVQARQLTHISYLNYEMRRQLKKYLFRYYVVGNFAQKSFPQVATSSNAPHDWVVGSGQNAKRFGIPIVCLFFSATDNFCQNPVLGSAIAGYTPNIVDPIGQTLYDALRKVEAIRQDNCKSIGIQNQTAQQLWLFNSDPNLSRLPSLSNGNPKIQKILGNLRSVAYGLGLIPREIILSMRTRTLETYVNQPSMQNVNLGKVGNLKTAADPAKNERSIQSFMSAYYNLGPNTFDASTVSMNELMPNELLRLNPIAVDQFDSYYTVVEPRGGQNNGGGADDCEAMLYPLYVTNRLELGFTKDPSVLTYYALSLEADANLLFLGKVHLKAMAAAQPFGSRIGPDLEVGTTVFTTGARPAVNFFLGGANGTGQQAFVQAKGILPNLPVYENDSSSASGGWNQVSVLGAMRAQMISVAGGSYITGQAMRQMQDIAMAPTPWERGRYNIPTSFPDPFVVNFDSEDSLAFWAPVLPLDESGDLSNRIRAKIQGLLSNAGGHSNTGANDPLAQILLTGLETYITDDLMNGRGENKEGFKIARIQDPLKTRDAQGRVVPVALPNIVMNTRAELKDSYVPEHLNPASRDMGRTGYSVKLVSFKQLFSPGAASSDGRTPWSNFPVGDPDLPAIEH